jgi:hypothetical protein
MTSRVRLLLAAVCVLGSVLAVAQDITNSESLLKAMHNRYDKTWYKTLTFTQKSTTYNPDGTTKVETWYEAAMLPGKLRIDVGDPSKGNGALMVDGTGYFFKEGKQVGTRPYLNLLLVLGFDVYGQSPQTTLDQLKGEKIDTAKFHEDSWNGQPVYVVGADKGDLKSKQFWVEKKQLLFLRLIQPDDRDPGKVEDIRFLNYRPLVGGMIAARVEVRSEDKLVFSEEYSEISANPKLAPAIFDPQQFARKHWEK